MNEKPSLSEDQLESICHVALVLNKTIQIGSQKADQKLRKLLQEHGSFKELYIAERTAKIESNMFKEQMKGELEKDLLSSLYEINGMKKVIEETGRIDFKTLTINDSKFPAGLRIESATPVIYYQGNLDLLKNPTIAVVGTRKPEYEDWLQGKLICKEIVKTYTIVSGLASGCDTIGHKCAVDNGAKTIAVLGTPLNKYYPNENEDLKNLI